MPIGFRLLLECQNLPAELVHLKPKWMDKIINIKLALGMLMVLVQRKLAVLILPVLLKLNFSQAP